MMALLPLARDPYGRCERWPIITTALVIAGLFLFQAWVFGVGEPSSPTWLSVLPIIAGFAAWVVASFETWWAGPAPNAEHRDGELLLRTSRRKLAVAVATILAPGYLMAAFAPWLPAIDAWTTSERAVGLSLLATANLLHYALSLVEVRVTSDGVERVNWPGRRKSIRWAEVSRLRAFPTGVMLGVEGQKPFWIWSKFLDGYPELAQEVLARVPPRVLEDPASGREALLRQAELGPQRSSHARDLRPE